MKRTTQIFALILALFLFLFPAVSAQAQGRGGGQSKGRTATVGQGSGQRGQQGKVGGQSGGIQDRKRIHATDQQRDQLRTCTGTADQIRQRAREMSRSANGPGFNADRGRKQRDELRGQVQRMQQEHDRLMLSLNDEQKTQLGERIRSMDEQRDRMRNQLQAMDQEFAQANPNGKRLSGQAREMERAMNEWQKQYRNMSNEMGVKP